MPNEFRMIHNSTSSFIPIQYLPFFHLEVNDICLIEPNLLSAYTVLPKVNSARRMIAFIPFLQIFLSIFSGLDPDRLIKNT